MLNDRSLRWTQSPGAKRYCIALALAVSSCTQPTPTQKSQESGKAVPANAEVDKCKIAVPQHGREMPEYQGASGYLGITSQYDMLDYVDRLPAPPWKVPTLQQSGPEKWDETGQMVEAKQKITVVGVQLSHQGYGSYDGELTVKLEDGRQIHIAPKYFVPTDWWNCTVEDAIKYSPVIAEVQAGAKPLDAEGRWADVDDGDRVFCANDSLPGPLTGQDLVVCFHYPPKRLYFDPKSLKVVY